MHKVAAEVNHQLKQIAQIRAAKDRFLCKSQAALLHQWLKDVQESLNIPEMMH